MSFTYHQIDSTADQDYLGIRNYTIIFRVESTVPVKDPILVYAAIPIYRGDSYPTDALARCKKVSASQDGSNNGLSWIVRYDYNNSQSDQGTISDDGTAPDSDPMAGSAEVQPDLRPPTFTLGSEKYQVPWLYDVQDPTKPIVFSNQQQPDPPMMRSKVRSSITIKVFKAMASDNLGNKLTYENRVNDGVWWGIPDQCALVEDYALETVYEHDAFWWSKTVKIVLDENQWREKILDMGTYERNSANADNPWIPIMHLGQPVTSPVPLNGAGRQLVAGNPFEYLPPDPSKGFAQYKKISFAGLI